MSFQKKEEAFEGEEIQEPIPSQRKRWNAMALRHRFSDLGKIIKNLPDKNPKDI